MTGGAATVGGAGSLGVIRGLARAVIYRRPCRQRRVDSGVTAKEAAELSVELDGGLVFDPDQRPDRRAFRGRVGVRVSDQALEDLHHLIGVHAALLSGGSFFHSEPSDGRRSM